MFDFIKDAQSVPRTILEDCRNMLWAILKMQHLWKMYIDFIYLFIDFFFYFLFIDFFFVTHHNKHHLVSFASY